MQSHHDAVVAQLPAHDEGLRLTRAGLELLEVLSWAGFPSERSSEVTLLLSYTPLLEKSVGHS